MLYAPRSLYAPVRCRFSHLNQIGVPVSSESQLLSKTVRIDKNGGPEELKLVELEVGEPGPGEIRIKHHAIGLNFIDVYQRNGVYALPMPLNLGMSAVGLKT
jgi:hypothetical protein